MMFMTFQPNPGDEIMVNGRAYTVGQHPAAPGVAYAKQEGRESYTSLYQSEAKFTKPRH
ncbi:hypothetical protein JCM10914_981 [Paenibacillus sp. JCM 10914]|nr:hypothetical protein JCM10914_981 [Paenibacillus sp. JCM 10914]